MGRVRRRAAVQDHVAAMRSRGLVFDVEFPERSLGLRVALARYGESGRRFVVVDSTERGSACFESVKPGDELCAVNGAAVVDPDEESDDVDHECEATGALYPIKAGFWVF